MPRDVTEWGRDNWREFRSWDDGHYPEDHGQPDEAPSEWRRYVDGLRSFESTTQIEVTTHADLSEAYLMSVEDDEPRETPDEPGPTPRWFIVAFGLAAIGCGFLALCGLITWIVDALK